MRAVQGAREGEGAQEMTQVKKKKSKPKAVENNELFMSIYHRK